MATETKVRQGTRIHWRKSEHDEATLWGIWGKQWWKSRDPSGVTCKSCLRGLRGLVVEEPRPRVIRLALAKDTTATECGACPRVIDMGNGGADRCGGLNRPLEFDDQTGHKRLPECIAAESK